ncbi:MAG: MarR family transcriptional regulator [Clostridia bacterium]|nr:MarR family transcriptional regulator [Clostridia bacterium]
MHIIEAISMLEKSKKNTMANVAKILSVSPGSLTTAVNTLVAKGYVDRERSEEDRRVVLVYPTEKGREVNNHHKKFHDEMVDFIGVALSDEEMENILKALERLTAFLKTKAAVKR